MENSETLLKNINEIYKQADREKREALLKVKKVFEGLDKRDKQLVVAANIGIITPPARLSTRLETYRCLMGELHGLTTREGVSPTDNELEAERILLKQKWWSDFIKEWKEKWSIYNEDDIGSWGHRHKKLQPYIYEFGYFYQTLADYKSSGSFKPTMGIGHVGPRKFISWRIDIKSNGVVPITLPVSGQLEKGLELTLRGRNEEAILEFNRYVKMKPNDAMAYVVRGDAHDDMGQFGKAINDYSRTIELEPKLAEAYDKRGVTYCQLGDYAKALKDFDRAIELHPENATYYYNRSLAYDSLSDVDKVIENCTNAIELDGKYAKAYYNRGIAYIEKAEHDKAISDFNRTIELQPEFTVDVYFNRGIAYQGKGEYKKALEDFKWVRKNLSDVEDIEIVEQKIRELTRGDKH